MDHRPCNGFTLVELILAIGLSTILIMVAFVVFRAAIRTVGDLNDLRGENQLIRAGYFLVMDDADYWRSHADPTFPWLRRHTSASSGDNDAYDVRPFRPVRWPSDLADPENPNWHQAHEPRSWYRNHLMPNVTTGTYIYESNQHRSGYYFEPDFHSNATKEELLDRPLFSTRITRPKGWETWHVVGDYAAISNIDMGVVPELDSAADELAGARPRQFWRAFRELGTHGIYAYTHPGACNLIQASSLNERQENYLDLTTRIDSHFRKGEIPWSLNFHENLATVRELGVLEGPRPVDDHSSYPASFATTYPDYNRQNYALFMPSTRDPGRYDGLAWRPFPFLSDLEIFTGDIRAKSIIYDVGFSSDQSLLVPMALYYADNPMVRSSGGDDFNWYEFDKDVVFPIQMQDVAHPLDFHKSVKVENWGQSQTFSPQTHYRNIRTAHDLATWHVPANHTGDPEPDLYQLGERQQALATRIYRYRHNGNDYAHCSIVLADSQGRKAYEVRLRTCSTTFRGARQHWGRRSGSTGVEDGFGNRVLLGDIYE